MTHIDLGLGDGALFSVLMLGTDHHNWQILARDAAWHSVQVKRVQGDAMSRVYTHTQNNAANNRGVKPPHLRSCALQNFRQRVERGALGKVEHQANAVGVLEQTGDGGV